MWLFPHFPLNEYEVIKLIITYKIRSRLGIHSPCRMAPNLSSRALFLLHVISTFCSQWDCNTFFFFDWLYLPFPVLRTQHNPSRDVPLHLSNPHPYLLIIQPLLHQCYLLHDAPLDLFSGWWNLSSFGFLCNFLIFLLGPEPWPMVY